MTTTSQRRRRHQTATAMKNNYWRKQIRLASMRLADSRIAARHDVQAREQHGLACRLDTCSILYEDMQAR